jgi:hypothetical protein
MEGIKEEEDRTRYSDIGNKPFLPNEIQEVTQPLTGE